MYIKEYSGRYHETHGTGYISGNGFYRKDNCGDYAKEIKDVSKMRCDMMKDTKQNQERKHDSEKGRKIAPSRIISNLVLVIAIGVFCFSGYKLFTIFSEYHKGSSEYDAIQNVAIHQNAPSVTEEDLPKEFTVDFDALKKMNSEVVGWIHFDEPSQISYPVVQGPDNDKYLNTTFEGKRNSAGALFVDKDNQVDFSDENTFIYGHNMKNGSMFGQLRKYKTKSFCEENPYFYIYTLDGKVLTYQVFSVCIVKDISRSYVKQYSGTEAFQDYIDYIRGISRYSVDVEVTGESQIVSLSTCTNVEEDERLLVHGVKISEETVDMIEE